MMKNLKKIFLGMIALIVLPKIVLAAGPVCDNESYRISKAGSNVFNLNGGNTYRLNYYNATSNGKTIKSYCLDPGRKGPSGTTYECERMIDPTGEISGVGSKQHALDVAISRAYYLLSQNHNGDNPFDRSIGEIVFRWLSFNYNLGVTEVSFNGGAACVNYFKMEQGGGIKPYWNGLSGTNGQIVEEAKTIFYDAVNVANKVYNEVGGTATYQDLVDAGLLPNEDFKPQVNITTDVNDSNHKIYEVKFTAPAGVGQVWWGEATVGVNGNASARIIENDGNGTIKVDVRATSSEYQYDVYVDIPYYMPSSASTNLKILKTKTNRDLQRMLVAVDSPGSAGASLSDSADASRKIIRYGRRHHLTNPCVKIDGEWYICDNTGIQDKNHCTPADKGVCEPEPVDNGKSCTVENGTFYGASGAVVTPLVFYDECCETGKLTQEEYNLYCPCGYPDIDYIGNCSEFNSDSEIVNKVKDTKDDANLTTCLFNLASVDAANNSVRMTDQTTVVNNRYCKVSCIEEYQFTLPNAKYTESGGYFNLTSQVSGKRTCYVNADRQGIFTGIDYDLFIQDLETKRREIIDAWNAYAPWKAAAAKTSEAETVTCTYSGRSCTGKGSSCRSCNGGSNSDTGYKKEWSWIRYDYNGNSYVETDSYGPGNPTDGTCSCSTNAEPNRDSEHRQKRDQTLAVLNQRITEYNAILRNYNNCSGSITTTTSNRINFPGIASSGWETDLTFNPVIDFTYDEPYQGMSGFNGKFEKISNNGVSASIENYCATSDPSYNCQGSSNVTTISPSYFLCSSEGCGNVAITYGSARFITKSKSQTETYKPQNNFSVYTPMGTIMLNKDSGLYTILCKEKDCLPVSLNSPTGVFNFKFKFSQIGQYNDSNENGRLMGGTNNVFDAVDLEAGYVCQYINNCPDCDYVCVGESCEITEDPDCKDGNCNYVCQNCIFDGKEMGYQYRTVSIHNLFPNERTYGPNWSNEKATCTIDLIQNEGEEIYKEPEYSYTLTPNQMRNIREYNKTVNGYLNTQMPDGSNALQCHSQGGYDNIYCISAFLDTEGAKYFTENKRNDIWTLWPNNEYCTSSTKYSVRDGMGPAWK